MAEKQKGQAQGPRVLIFVAEPGDLVHMAGGLITRAKKEVPGAMFKAALMVDDPITEVNRARHAAFRNMCNAMGLGSTFAGLKPTLTTEYPKPGSSETVRVQIIDPDEKKIDGTAEYLKKHGQVTALVYPHFHDVSPNQQAVNVIVRGAMNKLMKEKVLTGPFAIILGQTGNWLHEPNLVVPFDSDIMKAKAEILKAGLAALELGEGKIAAETARMELWDRANAMFGPMRAFGYGVDYPMLGAAELFARGEVLTSYTKPEKLEPQLVFMTERMDQRILQPIEPKP